MWLYSTHQRGISVSIARTRRSPLRSRCIGDWREEVVVLNGDRLHIYQNPQPNPQPDRPLLWEQNAYRRSKMTWNYYNP
ncbi:hypothetical protein HC928_12265 [bacterium]|nr:hypothetical protein [bacterium]